MGEARVCPRPGLTELGSTSSASSTIVDMASRQQISLIGIAVSVVVGTIVSVAGSDGSTKVGSIAVFALCGAAAFVINWIAFVPSNAAQTEHYYDLTGSITYITLIVLAVLLGDDLDARALVVALMVLVWAIRLGSFLFQRVRRDGRDGRFDKIKTNPLRFFMTWTLQGLWVLLTLACALAIITGVERRTFGVFAVVGAAVWVVGFAIEVLADRQKSVFKQNPANEGRFITSGLWAWSRHPNYFGEIVLWLGIAIMALPVLSGWRWVTLISPVFVVVLLTKISGIPLLERRGQRRWGDEQAYRDYVERTSVLVPLPPASR